MLESSSQSLPPLSLSAKLTMIITLQSHLCTFTLTHGQRLCHHVLVNWCISRLQKQKKFWFSWTLALLTWSFKFASWRPQFWCPWPSFKVTAVSGRSHGKVHFLPVCSSCSADFKLCMIFVHVFCTCQFFVMSRSVTSSYFRDWFNNKNEYLHFLWVLLKWNTWTMSAVSLSLYQLIFWGDKRLKIKQKVVFLLQFDFRVIILLPFFLLLLLLLLCQWQCVYSFFIVTFQCVCGLTRFYGRFWFCLCKCASCGIVWFCLSSVVIVFPTL